VFGHYRAQNRAFNAIPDHGDNRYYICIPMKYVYTYTRCLCLLEYRALLVECTARCRALLIECRALLIEYRGLLWSKVHAC